MKLVTFLLAALALAACSKPSGVAREEPTAKTAVTSAPSTKGESLYQLEATLTDQGGKKVPLDVFRGHLTIVSMFYATCPSACPRLVHDVKLLEGRIDPALKDRVRVLLVSFDTARDTPEVLTKMAEKHDVDLARWKMTVAPSDESARELAAVLGFQYRKIGNGDYSHSSRVSLLDENGVVIAQADGLGQAAEELLPEIKKRLK